MTLVQRRLLGLVLALFGVGGAMWALQRYQGQLTAQQTVKIQQSKLFASLSGAHVKRLTLHAPDRSFVLLREGGPEAPWMLESPLRTLADDSVVQGMVHSLLETSVKQILDDKAAAVDLPSPQNANQPSLAGGNELALFGLAPPLYHITASGPADDGNDRLAVVMLGKKNSFDQTVYAKRAGAGPVLLVGSEIIRAVDKDLFELRDKRPIALSAPQITHLHIEQAADGKVPGRRFDLDRQGAHFNLSTPDGALRAAADDSQVDTLLGALCGLRAKRIVAEAKRHADLPAVGSPAEKADLQLYGMAPPKFLVQLHWQDAAGQPSDANLLLGQLHLGQDTHYFAKRAGNYPVIELGADWAFKKLSVPLDELRDLHVSQFDPDAVEQIRLQTADASLVLQKTPHPDKAPGAHLWHVRQTSGEQGDELQDVRVIGLLYKLKDLRSPHLVVAKPRVGDLIRAGLQAPRRSVEFLGADGQALGGLDIGLPKAAEPSITLVRRRGTEWIGEVATSSLADVVADANHFLAPQDAAASNPNAPAAQP